MKYTSVQVIIVGSGVAGLTAAIHLAKNNVDVAVLTKDNLADSATNIAQGGIAVVMHPNGDSPKVHLEDTLAAGAGLCDREATELLVREGPERVRELIESGAHFDRDQSGKLMTGREGGHSFSRVIHAGGAATGAEVERSLLEYLSMLNVKILEGYTALDLIKKDGKVTGLQALSREGEQTDIRSEFVVLATGGASQLFPLTTSPIQSTGDGLAMALRAGVVCADIEFVQFHPTALAIGASPRPLLSEAIRGEGALLLDHSGKRFVDELLPRDIVSRKMAEKMAEDGSTELFLDVRPIDGFAAKFPNIYDILQSVGFDPSEDLLPVAPAAHYLCGGVLVDLDGFSLTKGLCAIGEVACNGVHGANRLASNSLLDGLVSGARLAKRIIDGAETVTLRGAVSAAVMSIDRFMETEGDKENDTLDKIPLVYLPDRNKTRQRNNFGVQSASMSDKDSDHLQTLRNTAGKYLSMSRSEEGLSLATKEIDALVSSLPDTKDRHNIEIANMALIAEHLIYAADVRKESRGAHVRSEFTGQDQKYKVRFIQGSKDVLLGNDRLSNPINKLHL